jgi:hypothetical protein
VIKVIYWDHFFFDQCWFSVLPETSFAVEGPSLVRTVLGNCLRRHRECFWILNNPLFAANLFEWNVAPECYWRESPITIFLTLKSHFFVVFLNAWSFF